MFPSSLKISILLALWLLIIAGVSWSGESSRSLLSPRCKKPIDCAPNCPHCQFVTCLNTWCVCGCPAPPLS
ncbi:unnamed protein product [Amaranthus hypochondriacus]